MRSTSMAGRLRVSALLWAAAGGAGADTVELVAVADATLIEEPTGALANGRGINFFAGRVGANAGQTRRRALLRFDMSAIPAGAVIQSAALTLSLTRSRFAGDLPVTVHRVSASWNEGPSESAQGIGDASVDTDVTWLHRNKPALLWATPGGDHQATASASRIVGATGGAYVWSSTPQLVADVQQWLDAPASNHGWLLRGFEGSGSSAKGFAARETATATDRPRLTVQYLPPMPAADANVPLPLWSLLLFAAAMGGGILKRRSHG